MIESNVQANARCASYFSNFRYIAWCNRVGGFFGVAEQTINRLNDGSGFFAGGRAVSPSWQIAEQFTYFRSVNHID